MATAAIHPERFLTIPDAEPATLEPAPEAPERGALEVVDELLGLVGGLGFFLVAFLAPIPGLLAVLALVALPLVILAIPLLVLGAVVGGLFALLRLLTRALLRTG